GGAEERAGGDQDAQLEQPPRRLDGWAADGEPEEEGRVAARGAQARRLEGGEERLALPRVHGPDVVDVPVVRVGGDPRPLDELLRRRADAGAEGAERVADFGRRADEAAAVAGHRRTLRERVEDDDGSAVRHLQGGRRPLAEPELGIRLVGADEEAVLPRTGCELLVERERRRRAGRVRRVARPEEGELVPAVERVEVRKPRPLRPQRHADDLRAGE